MTTIWAGLSYVLAICFPTGYRQYTFVPTFFLHVYDSI